MFVMKTGCGEVSDLVKLDFAGLRPTLTVRRSLVKRRAVSELF